MSSIRHLMLYYKYITINIFKIIFQSMFKHSIGLAMESGVPGNALCVII
jgi:hypothetical protein